MTLASRDPSTRDDPRAGPITCAASGMARRRTGATDWCGAIMAWAKFCNSRASFRNWRGGQLRLRL